MASFLFAAASAQADDALRCFEFVQAQQIDEARPVCRNLELSDPEAAAAYGFFLLHGEIGRERLQKIGLSRINPVTPDEKRTLESARRHLLTAAKAGIPGAQMLLATTLLILEPPEVDSAGIRHNEERTYWLRKAADNGVAEANYLLGLRALSPAGTLLEEAEYLPYLEHAARLGYADAAARLDKYETARRLMLTDSVEDPEMLRQHAVDLLSQPNGNVKEGMRLLRRLADAGDDKSMLMIGKGSWPGDAAEAKRYLAMAAARGNRDAMLALGNWHACNGDANQANRWFRKARDANHPEGAAVLKELAEWGVDEWECRFL